MGGFDASICPCFGGGGGAQGVQGVGSEVGSCRVLAFVFEVTIHENPKP